MTLRENIGHSGDNTPPKRIANRKQHRESDNPDVLRQKLSDAESKLAAIEQKYIEAEKTVVLLRQSVQHLTRKLLKNDSPLVVSEIVNFVEESVPLIKEVGGFQAWLKSFAPKEVLGDEILTVSQVFSVLAAQAKDQNQPIVDVANELLGTLAKKQVELGKGNLLVEAITQLEIEIGVSLADGRGMFSMTPTQQKGYNQTRFVLKQRGVPQSERFVGSVTRLPNSFLIRKNDTSQTSLPSESTCR